jgi:molecular chaperone GrpE
MIDRMNTEPPPPAAAGPEAAAAVPTPIPDSATLQQELAQQKDVHLRLAADFENFKRRTRQESEGRALAQKEAFILELLPVIDNFERALASGAVADSKQFRQGVEMTLQQLQGLLSQHGIESDEIVGQPFDPHLHEALSQRRDPDQADHTILEMFQRGYRRGTKIVRPAKVVVNDLTRSHHAPHAH